MDPRQRSWSALGNAWQAIGIVLLLVVASACADSGVAPERREQVAVVLEATLPAVERTQTSPFQNDGCRALGAARGQFSDGPTTDCGLFPEGDVLPFDADARAAWDDLKTEFDEAGAANLQYAVFFLDQHHAVQAASCLSG